MTFKEFFSFKKNKMFWLNIIGMFVFVLIVVFIALKGIDIYTRHGESINVPNVQGMYAEKAMQTLKLSHLDAAVVDSCYVPNIPSGVVVDQQPLAGARVKQGRQVYLTICTNKTPMRTIPDVIDNCSLREAQARMLAAGFKLTENDYISGEKDWVYGVRYNGRNLAPEAKVPIGATLTLVVGSDNIMPVDSLYNGEEIDNADNTSADGSGQTNPDESWF